MSLGARASRPHKTWQGRGDWLHRVGRFTCRLTLEQRLDKYAGGTPALPGGNPWLARCRSLSRALFCRSILPPSHARLRILQKAPLTILATFPLKSTRLARPVATSVLNISHSRNSNRRICVAPAGFGEAAPVHLTSGPSSLFPFGDFVDLLMYFKEVSCSHQRKFLARRSFGHWEPHRFTGSSRPSCNPGFTEVLSWVQVEGWRERRPAFVKDILGNYIHDLDVFEFSLTPFRPCQLQKIYCISVRFRCTVAEYGEQKCLFEQCSCCFPACLNVGVVRVSFFPYGIEKGHILEARGANRTVPIFLAPTLMPGTHTYSNVTVEENISGSGAMERLRWYASNKNGSQLNVNTASSFLRERRRRSYIVASSGS